MNSLTNRDMYASGELFRAMALTSPECIKVVARDGRLLQMNPAGLAMIGADSWQRVEHASALDLVAPEHQDMWLANHERVCAGETRVWEFDMVGLKGIRRSMETHASQLLLSDGSTAQLAITRDVTERNKSRQAQQQLTAELEDKVQGRTHELEAALHRLQESERSFQLLVESVTDYALYMLDPTGRVISWNSGAKRIKGYEAADIIGKNFECFYSEQDRAAGVPAAGLRTAAREGRLETEGWRLRKDGTRFWANVIIDAITSDGHLVGYAKITRDITERRAAEARLRQAQKMEAVGQFTGGAAHDFNNLLMAILGSLEILRKRLPNDPRLLALLDNAVQGAKRGSSLTQRMLAFARQQDLKTVSANIGSLVSGMQELLRRSLGPQIALHLHIDKNLPPARVDAHQVELAVLNLAINARDAMPDGGVIDVRVDQKSVDGEAQLEPGTYVRVQVADSGCGMDAVTLSKAIEPFFSTKPLGKGTGLGLSMTHGLAVQLGGHLDLSSEVGVGTVATLWLPMATEPATELEAPPQPSRVSRCATILVVDDDPLIAMSTVDMLEDLGHVVIEAHSGQRALEIIDGRGDIDLMMTDQAMPGMTGIQLAEIVRSKRPELPVLLATGYTDLPASKLANLPRLAKPYQQAQLQAEIEKLLDTA